MGVSAAGCCLCRFVASDVLGSALAALCHSEAVGVWGLLSPFYVTAASNLAKALSVQIAKSQASSSRRPFLLLPCHPSSSERSCTSHSPLHPIPPSSRRHFPRHHPPPVTPHPSLVAERVAEIAIVNALAALPPDRRRARHPRVLLRRQHHAQRRAAGLKLAARQDAGVGLIVFVSGSFFAIGQCHLRQ
jgi:hypothetical protein